MSERAFRKNGWVRRRRAWPPVASIDPYGVAPLACDGRTYGIADAEARPPQSPPPVEQMCAKAWRKVVQADKRPDLKKEGSL